MERQESEGGGGRGVKIAALACSFPSLLLLLLLSLSGQQLRTYEASSSGHTCSLTRLLARDCGRRSRYELSQEQQQQQGQHQAKKK